MSFIPLFRFPSPLFSYPMWNKVAPQHFHIWKLPLNRPREPYCSGITCIVHWMVIIVPDMRVVPFSRVPSGVSVQVIVTLGNSVDKHLHGCGLTMYMYVCSYLIFAVGNVWTHDRTQFAVRPCGLYRDHESSLEYVEIKWNFPSMEWKFASDLWGQCDNILHFIRGDKTSCFRLNK